MSAFFFIRLITGIALIVIGAMSFLSNMPDKHIKNEWDTYFIELFIVVLGLLLIILAILYL